MPDSSLKKIAFVDRDGVINKNPPTQCYVTKVEDFHFNPGIFNVLTDLKSRGFEFIVVTNQRGIARGQMTEETLTQIHNLMLAEFKKHDIEILDVFHCPHDNGVCDCRKPKPGMLIKAVEKYSIDLENSIFLSDTEKDVQMAKDFSIGKQFLVPVDHPEAVVFNFS